VGKSCPLISRVSNLLNIDRERSEYTEWLVYWACHYNERVCLYVNYDSVRSGRGKE